MIIHIVIESDTDKTDEFRGKSLHEIRNYLFQQDKKSGDPSFHIINVEEAKINT